MASLDRVHLQRLSQVAFGQRYRLQVMLAVAAAEDGFVSLSALARELDVATSNLQGPIRALVALGLLAPVPHGDSKHRFYMRNPSAAWGWAQELSSYAAQTPAAPSP